MKTLIRTIVCLFFSISSIAQPHLDPQTPFSIKIESSDADRTIFRLQVPSKSTFSIGSKYYFYDNTNDKWYSAIYDGINGNYTKWIYLTEEQFSTESPSSKISQPRLDGIEGLESIHNDALHVGLSAGLTHAIYLGFIWDNQSSAKLKEFNEKSNYYNQITINNYHEIKKGLKESSSIISSTIDTVLLSLNVSFFTTEDIKINYANANDLVVWNDIKALKTIMLPHRTTDMTRSLARSTSLQLLDRASKYLEIGDSENARVMLRYSQVFADIALGLNPITGVLRDVYEAFTGKNLLTGEELDEWERGFALIGAVTFGYGSRISKGISAISKIIEKKNLVGSLEKVSILKTHVEKSIAYTNSPNNRAQFERYLADLRKEMTKPSINDPRLKKVVDWYWRPESSIGNGSTAAAYRLERIINTKIKGKSHTDKINQSLGYFKDWLASKGEKSPTDIAAVENLIKDIESALKGN